MRKINQYSPDRCCSPGHSLVYDHADHHVQQLQVLQLLEHTGKPGYQDRCCFQHHGEADARTRCRIQSDGNDAAAKFSKEDDIGNIWGTMNNVIENKEVKNNENDTKEDKIDCDENKKLKVIKNEDKTNKKNKNIIKKKQETPRPELKSIIKNKSKSKTAKPSDVNERKITEVLLLNKDETPKPKNAQKPAEKPAKQDFLQKNESLSDNRMGGGGKQAVMENYFLNGNITQPSKGIQGGM